MANYSKSDTKKQIVIKGKLTEAEREVISFYRMDGYEIKAKSSGRKGLSYDDMKKDLKGKETLLKELETKIKAKENYMKVKKWFLEQTK